MTKLSVVIPAYNEADLIAETIKTVQHFLSVKKIDFEIIVVDDGSQDLTASIVASFPQTNIRLLENRANKGKGYSIRQGIIVARHNTVLISDADLSTPISELDKLIGLLKKNDIVIGSRRIFGGRIIKPQPHWKEQAGKIGNYLINKLLSLNYNDTQCGFKLLGEKSLPLVHKLTINRWGFDFELLYLAKKHCLRVKEVGVDWVNNTDTAVKPIDYLKTLKDLFVIRINNLIGKYK